MRLFTLVYFALLASSFSASAQEHDWSGSYAGASVGIVWSDTDLSTVLNGGWDLPTEQIDRDSLLPLLNSGLDGAGAFGGLTLGHNFQNGGLVYGVEADVGLIDFEESRSAFNVPGIVQPHPFRVDTVSQVDWAATFRGRLGWAFGPSLFYITGGLATGGHELTQHITQLVLPAGIDSFEQGAASQKTLWGWTLGVGVEQALSEQWSLKLQYQHINLGSHGAQSTGHCSNVPIMCTIYTGSHQADVKLDTVSASINYRF